MAVPLSQKKAFPQNPCSAPEKFRAFASPCSDDFPVGSMVMWARTIAEIPCGWAIADGTANASGCDPRQYFAMGTGEDDKNCTKVSPEEICGVHSHPPAESDHVSVDGFSFRDYTKIVLEYETVGHTHPSYLDFTDHVHFHGEHQHRVTSDYAYPEVVLGTTVKTHFHMLQYSDDKLMEAHAGYLVAQQLNDHTGHRHQLLESLNHRQSSVVLNPENLIPSYPPVYTVGFVNKDHKPRQGATGPTDLPHDLHRHEFSNVVGTWSHTHPVEEHLHTIYLPKELTETHSHYHGEKHRHFGPEMYMDPSPEHGHTVIDTGHSHTIEFDSHFHTVELESSDHCHTSADPTKIHLIYIERVA